MDEQLRNDPEKLLEFAVKFAQIDIHTLREGDWLNLCEDFWVFLYPLADAAVVLPGSYGQLQSRDEAEALRKELREFLGEIVGAAEQGEKWKPKSYPISFDLSVGISREAAGRTAGDVPWLLINGPMRDRMLLNLLFLLSRTSTEKIRRCRATDCDRIFYKVRKQQFCSVRCQSRDFMRRFRNDPEYKDKESEQNHRKYKKRVEKARGRPTRVDRRLRRKT